MRNAIKINQQYNLQRQDDTQSKYLYIHKSEQKL